MTKQQKIIFKRRLGFLFEKGRGHTTFFLFKLNKYKNKPVLVTWSFGFWTSIINEMKWAFALYKKK